MTWGISYARLNKQIGDLLDEATKGNELRADFIPALEREKAEQIIHAVIWAACCRSSSTAAVYALDSLFKLLKLDQRMEFEKRASVKTTVAGFEENG